MTHPPQPDGDCYDRRAHDRIDHLEGVMTDYVENHRRLELSLIENSEMTKQIAANTAELVALFQGAKMVHKLVLWITPIAAAGIALWAYAKGGGGA